MSALQWPVGCHEDGIPGRDLAERLRALLAVGLHTVELNGWRLLADPDAVRRTLDQFPDVRVSTVCGGMRATLLAADRSQRERALADAQELLRLAQQLGAGGVIIAPVLGPPRLPDLEPIASLAELEADLAAKLLLQLAETAEACEVDVLLEPINRYRTHFMHRLADGVALCKAVGSPRMRIMADLFHMAIEEDNPAAAMHEAGPYVRHIHLADSNRAYPGRGETNFSAVLAALRAISYGGALVFECSPTPDFATEVRSALAFLESAATRPDPRGERWAPVPVRSRKLAMGGPAGFMPGPDPTLSGSTPTTYGHLLDLHDRVRYSTDLSELREALLTLVEHTLREQM